MVRAAEESAVTLAGSIHPEQCIKVLCPIVQTADYPINLAAIKMQTKVIERIAKESLPTLLPDVIPGLLQVSASSTPPTPPLIALLRQRFCLTMRHVESCIVFRTVQW